MYTVNFSPQLSEIISETKYMEKLGFDVSACKMLPRPVSNFSVPSTIGFWSVPQCCLAGGKIHYISAWTGVFASTLSQSSGVSHGGWGKLLLKPGAFFHLISLVQVELMEGHIQSLQKSIRPGCKRLNWNSLGIQEYIAKNEEVFPWCLYHHCDWCVDHWRVGSPHRDGGWEISFFPYSVTIYAHYTFIHGPACPKYVYCKWKDMSQTK